MFPDPFMACGPMRTFGWSRQRNSSFTLRVYSVYSWHLELGNPIFLAISSPVTILPERAGGRAEETERDLAREQTGERTRPNEILRERAESRRESGRDRTRSGERAGGRAEETERDPARESRRESGRDRTRSGERERRAGGRAEETERDPAGESREQAGERTRPNGIRREGREQAETDRKRPNEIGQRADDGTSVLKGGQMGGQKERAFK